MLTVDDFLKLSGNQYANIASISVPGDVKNFVDSGSYTFNALLSGDIYLGLPESKIVSLIGEEAVGKSFYALGACKNFLDKDKTAIVLYFETEGSLTSESLNARNIDKNRLIILPVVTVQDFKNQCLTILEEYSKQKSKQPLMIVLDSLGNLSTTKELTDSLSGSDTRDMTRAQIIKAAFRVLSLKMSTIKVPMILTNHVYDNIGGGLYAGKVQSGGRGSKYAASITISLSKSKEKDGDIQIGSVITCTVVKSRFVREGLRVKTLIRFDGGLDRYYGLLDIAEKAGIFKKVSTKYETPQGKFFGKSIETNPERFFTSDILEKINQYVNSNFKFISTGENLGSDEDLIEVEDTDLDDTLTSILEN